ncbi:MAG: pyridoxamine 5'-phosphate oxidase family protein [Planctomycetota bacterium]
MLSAIQRRITQSGMRTIRKDIKMGNYKSMIVGTLFLASLLGCSNAPNETTKETTEPKTIHPAEPVVEYEFYNRGQTSQDEIETIIGSVVAGYIIVTDEYPQSLLVNYLYRSKCIYFPLNTNTHKDFIKLIQAKPTVFFGVDKYTALYWWSANITGQAEIINDASQVTRMMKDYEKSLGKAGFNYQPESERANTVFIKVTPDFISGRKMQDPQNQNFAAKIPWLGLTHNRANTGIPARLLPMKVDNVTIAKDLNISGLAPEAVEAILRDVRYCRFNMFEDDAPYSITMSTFGYKDGKVLLHSNNKGKKMDCLRKNTKAGLDYMWFWNNSPWIALNLEGDIRIIDTAEELSKTISGMGGMGMGGGQPGVPNEMFQRMAQRVALLEFTPKKIRGSQIAIPEDWYPMMIGTRTE